MIRTLIVEDDFRVAEVHQAFVERVPGFVVVGTAHTTAQAIDLARSLSPDLVLLDMYLPDRPGLEVLRALRNPGAARTAPVDVIVITAARDVETLRAALQWGVIHYLVKPFRFTTFRERLEAYAQVRSQLAASGMLDQGKVDRIVGLLRSETATTLPKGMSTVTLELVANALNQAETTLSAGDVAGLIGVSRVTSRRYLEHLSRLGLAALSMRYGSSGRPGHRYQWVKRAEDPTAR